MSTAAPQTARLTAQLLGGAPPIRPMAGDAGGLSGTTHAWCAGEGA